jgi:CheY-like chemotaxis protein
VDPSQTEAAILNLVVNAKDAVADKGKLTIETANVSIDERYSQQIAIPAGQYIQIAVSDTGRGMLKEVQEKAFDSFFTTKQPGQGTGLGLSQVYGFVRQSGGHVKIFSEEGRGTTSKIYLPRSHITLDQIKDDAVTLVGSLGSETILVVEDESDVRSYLVETLQDLNYSVREAPDGATALALFDVDQFQIDLLLTDIVMPGINGRQLADELCHRQPSLKVQFMTGYARDAIVHHGRLDVGVSMLQKPLTQATLAAKIRHILDQPQTAFRAG